MHGLESVIVIDRDTAGRLGVSVLDIDNTLSDAFGQRQVSNIYKGLNQYHVVLEVAPEFQPGPDALKSVYVPSKSGKLVPAQRLRPLRAFQHRPFRQPPRHLPGNHPFLQSRSWRFAWPCCSAYSGSPARTRYSRDRPRHVPGTAQAYQDSLSNQPVLIITALAAVYIVLGILYESFIHPITILSTIPSAGIGALLAIQFIKSDLNIIALIGIILLIASSRKMPSS